MAEGMTAVGVRAKETRIRDQQSSMFGLNERPHE